MGSGTHQVHEFEVRVMTSSSLILAGAHWRFNRALAGAQRHDLCDLDRWGLIEGALFDVSHHMT